MIWRRQSRNFREMREPQPATTAAANLLRYGSFPRSVPQFQGSIRESIHAQRYAAGRSIVIAAGDLDIGTAAGQIDHIGQERGGANVEFTRRPLILASDMAP